MEMLPNKFKTKEEIIKKLVAVARVHEFQNIQVIAQIFYDVVKIAYYALKQKRERIRRKKGYPIILKRKEITKLMNLMDYYYIHDKTFTVKGPLTDCFGSSFNEKKAWKYFEAHVEGNVKDKYDRNISIDIEDGIKFMYKNPETGRHDIKSEYYEPTRGKRLPWIRHTIMNSKNIYAKIDKEQLELMYLCKYEIPLVSSENNLSSFIVIVKKYRKDRISPFKFKTAFSIIDYNYNRLLKRLVLCNINF